MIESSHQSSRRLRPFILSVAMMAVIAACRPQATTNYTASPGGNNATVMEPKPVDPTEVDELRELFNLVSSKIRAENPKVRDTRPIAKLLKAKRRDKSLIIRTRPEAVILKNGQNPETPILAAGGVIKRRHMLISVVTAEFPAATDEVDLQAVATFLQSNLHVASVEPDYLVKAIQTPNDAQFGKLWGLKNTVGTGPDIGVSNVWDRTTGSKDIVVGIIDSGIDYNHPDLAANIWKNFGETGTDVSGKDKTSNGIDDDNNGYIDDWRGWNFIRNNNNPMDDNEHGTHVAGTIGAVGNNATGVAGVNWNVSLVGLKFLDSSGGGYTSDAIAAVEYAVKMKFFATNNSWGGGGYSQSLFDAIKKARDGGQLFVAAAGNDGANNDSFSSYPANFALDNIISVAALDKDGNLAWFSNYGKNKVHVAAPGMEIFSTIPGNQYDSLNGTSMAAPHVTGAAALMKAAIPSLTAEEIKQRLIATTTSIPSSFDKVMSSGMINVESALSYQKNTVPPSPPGNVVITAAGLSRATITWSEPDKSKPRIKQYEIRFATSPIKTEDEWTKATAISTAEYTVASNKVTATFTLPMGSKGYLALKATDFDNNVSSISASIPIELLPLVLSQSWKGDSLTGLPQTPWVIAKDPIRGNVYRDRTDGYPANADRALRLPAINSSDLGLLVLRFWNRREIGFEDTATIEIQADSDIAPVIAKQYQFGSNSWEFVELDLKHEMSQLRAHPGVTNIQIIFRLKSGNKVLSDGGWSVDDIEVLAASPFTLTGVPSTPSTDDSIRVTLSQTPAQKIYKISKYKYTLSPDDGQNCDFSDRQWRPFSEPISSTITSYGKIALCIMAPVDDTAVNLFISRVWARPDGKAPVGDLSSAPKGVTSSSTEYISISGANVVSYSYLMSYAGQAACKTGTYSGWLTDMRLRLANLKEGVVTLCVKARGAAGEVQLEPSIAQWTVDLTPPGNAILSGTPPTSSLKPTGSITVSAQDATRYIYHRTYNYTECGNYSAPVPINQKIELGLVRGQNTEQSLCVIAIDSAGNRQKTPTKIQWFQDAIAYEIEFLDKPAANSNATSLNITVKTYEAGQYRYLLQPGNACATDALRAAPLRAASEKITDTLPEADGPYTLCGEFVDSAGNIQDKPTTYTWTKMANPKATLSNTPPARTTSLDINIKVGGTTVQNYKYALLPGSGPCPEDSYSATIPVDTPIMRNVAGPGMRILCVKGIDALGQVQSSPTTLVWSVVKIVPVYPLVSGAPSSINYQSSVRIAVSSPTTANLVSYRYAIAKGLKTDCPKALANTQSRPMSEPINHDFGSYEGYVYLCVVAKDATGYEQPVRDAYQWLQVAGTVQTPSTSVYARATFPSSSRPTSRVVMISRLKATATTLLPAATLQSRACRVDEATGEIILSSCVARTLNFPSKSLTITTNYDGLSKGRNVLIITPPIGIVVPVLFNIL